LLPGKKAKPPHHAFEHQDKFIKLKVFVAGKVKNIKNNCIFTYDVYIGAKRSKWYGQSGSELT
jgi:hypothetical protein